MTAQQTLEFKLISPKSEDGFIKAIEFNYEDLRAGLETALEKYQGLTYTDETISEAKPDRAKLNKVIEALENRRKEIKAKCLEPYNDFEKKIEDLVALAEQPKNAIDNQVKAYEEKKKTAKKAEIEAFYNQKVGDLKEIISLEKIFNNTWLNTTVTMKKIEAEIIQIIEKIDGDLEAIQDLKSEFELNLMDLYLKDFDLGAVLRENTRLQEVKQTHEARKNQSEQKLEKVEPVVKENLTVEQFGNTEQLKTYKFKIRCTKEKAFALADYMKQQGIEFEAI